MNDDSTRAGKRARALRTPDAVHCARKRVFAVFGERWPRLPNTADESVALKSMLEAEAEYLLWAVSS